MLANPRTGWVTVTLGEFTDRASYLTNVPVDCLKALIFSLEHRKPASVRIDAEGWEYVITFTLDETYIVRTKGSHELFVINKNNMDFAREVYEDIKRDYKAWLDWDEYGNGKSLYDDNIYEIPTALFDLKQLLVIHEIGDSSKNESKYKTCPDDYSFEAGM
ncbi:MAG TPA: hypothetical protein PK114_00025 [Smithellaceae bacterium]|nr:hypothetical protein [Smithellaceae bacterium]